MMNMGSTIIFAVVLIISLPFLGISLLLNKSGKFVKLTNWIIHKLMWNTYLRFMMQ
jgi:hypothetical protein